MNRIAIAAVLASATTAAWAHTGHGTEGPLHLIAEHPLLVAAVVAGLVAAAGALARRRKGDRE